MSNLTYAIEHITPGYNLAMGDLYLIIAELMTVDNKDFLLQIAERMEMQEAIRKETGVLFPKEDQ